MKKILPVVFLLLSGCSLFEETKLVDIVEIEGPCTIILTSGASIVSYGNMEISRRTQAITYRDENGKLWSVFKDDYSNYSCE